MTNGLAGASLAPRRLRFDAVEPVRNRERLGWSLPGGWESDGTQALQEERRTDARLVQPGFECRVSWRQWLSAREQPVLIVNISRGGALIFLDEPPAPGRRLSLTLETPRQRASVPARVLEVRRTRQGQATVRIGFRRSWPYELFEAAVCGLSPVGPRSRPRSRPERSGPEAESQRDGSDA